MIKKEIKIQYCKLFTVSTEELRREKVATFVVTWAPHSAQLAPETKIEVDISGYLCPQTQLLQCAQWQTMLL